MQWNGESGKLVERMFDVVKARLADPSTFVVVLIDEVESLTSARKSANSGNECSDSLRAVNALLVSGFWQSSLSPSSTDPDRHHQEVPQRPRPGHLQPHWQHRPGLRGQVSPCLPPQHPCTCRRRADIKQYVGLPPPEAIAQMLDSALQVTPCTLPSPSCTPPAYRS